MKYLELPSSFSPAQPAVVRHNVSNHPLLELPSLTALAKRLPRSQVRFHSGRIAVTTRFDEAPSRNSTGLTIEQTLEDIEHSGSFVALQHIESDPEYKPLVDAVLADIRAAVEPYESGVGRAAGWVFISSPNSVTPYHRDHETNFLMQVRGSKQVHVWDPANQSVVNDHEQEVFHHAWTLKETIYRDELEQYANKMELTPGVCAYMPFTAPHWVQNGPEVSISLSVTYLTDQNFRETNVFRANHMLRRIGLKPARYGVGPLHGVRDFVKDLGFRAVQRVRGRYDAPPSMAG